MIFLSKCCEGVLKIKTQSGDLQKNAATVHEVAYLHSPWTVTFLVANTVDAGVSVIDWQVYCPPWDVCRGLNERVRVVLEPVVLSVPTVMALPLVTVVPLLEYSH